MNKEKIIRIAQEEKEKYEKEKAEFYSDPLHWDNNKRKRRGLPVLRGIANKYRSKSFRSFCPIRLFNVLEDTIDEILTDKFKSNKFFDGFVDVKNMTFGDANVFYVE